MTDIPLGGVGPPMACDVCGVRLNTHELWDEGQLQKISWHHMLMPEGFPEHEAVPTPLDPNAIPRVGFCDFCTAPNPAWMYPTSAFQAPLLFERPNLKGGTDRLAWGSEDNWSACHECRNDIEALKWDAIERRYFHRKAVPKIPGYKNALRGDIRILHRQFRLHRLGPPFLVRRGAGS